MKQLLGILGWLGVVLVLAALALKVLKPELNYHPKLALAGLVVTGLYALSQWRDIGRSFQDRNVKYGSFALGSVVIFGLIINHAGLVLSTILLIVMASAASTEFRPKEAVISGILLAILAVGVFVIGLKLQIGIWPGSR